MFWPNQPFSDVQVVVVKESAAHCEAVLFLLCGCLGLLMVVGITHLFNFCVHELHMFAFTFFCFVYAPLTYTVWTGAKLQSILIMWGIVMFYMPC
jgi:hypothetical protein